MSLAKISKTSSCLSSSSLSRLFYGASTPAWRHFLTWTSFLLSYNGAKYHPSIVKCLNRLGDRVSGETFPARYDLILSFINVLLRSPM